MSSYKKIDLSPLEDGDRKLVEGEEITRIYRMLAEIDSDEIAESLKKRDTLKNMHIFDVISARNSISYRDIFQKIKILSKEWEEKGRIFFEEVEADVLIDDGKAFYNKGTKDDKDLVEVELCFIPSVAHLKDKKKKPYLLLAKGEYINAISRLARGATFTSEKGTAFSFVDIISESIDRNISDIHITFSELYFHTSFRVDGDLINEAKYLLSREEGVAFMKRIKQEASKYTKGSFNADEHDLPQGARIEYPKLGASTRLQFTPRGVLDGLNSLTTRILKEQTIDKLTFSFTDMGYDEEFVDVLDASSHLNSGLILVAGVTGSGKSTLLSHFAVSLPNTKRIMTFEDPIEYKMEGFHITQHQVYSADNEKISVTFFDYVKSSKRSDPDVIYIGEVRKDKGNDLIDALVESAKAGQLVLSTIHINSAFDVHKTLSSVFGVDKNVVAELLLLVINQVLIKKLCPHCKVKDVDNINKKQLEKTEKSGGIRYAFREDLHKFLKDENAETYIRNKKGCSLCINGIAGRKPIYEFVKPDVEFVQWLGQGNLERFAIEERACSQGNRYLGKNKLTNYIEALRAGETDTHYDVMDKIVS